GSAHSSGAVPPTSHTPCVAAARARNDWIGPRPSGSRALTLSPSRRPMMQKYSGSATNFAPWRAASPMSASASARFAATSGPDTICTAATLNTCSFVMASSSRGRLVGLVRPDALDARLGPCAGHAVLDRKDTPERILEDTLRQPRPQRRDRAGEKQQRRGRV